MGVREAKVERYLDDKVKDIGGLTRKWVSPGVDGVPDRIVILNGQVWFVEIKTVDGKLSSVQQREHDRLREYSVHVATVYGLKGVEKFVNCLVTGFDLFQNEEFK